MRGSLDMPILACLDELECAYPVSQHNDCVIGSWLIHCYYLFAHCTACMYRICFTLHTRVCYKSVPLHSVLVWQRNPVHFVRVT